MPDPKTAKTTPKLQAKKQVPEKKKDVEEFNESAYTILAKRLREEHGVLPFSLGGVVIRSEMYPAIADRIGGDKDIRIYQATSESLEGRGGLTVTKGSKARIFLSRSLKKNTWLPLLVHEVTHVICDAEYPTMAKESKESACYVAQFLCLNKHQVLMDLEDVKGFDQSNAENALFRAADELAVKIQKQGKGMGLDAQKLFAIFKKHPEFLHVTR